MQYRKVGASSLPPSQAGSGRWRDSVSRSSPVLKSGATRPSSSTLLCWEKWFARTGNLDTNVVWEADERHSDVIRTWCTEMSSCFSCFSCCGCFFFFLSWLFCFLLLLLLFLSCFAFVFVCCDLACFLLSRPAFFCRGLHCSAVACIGALAHCNSDATTRHIRVCPACHAVRLKQLMRLPTAHLRIHLMIVTTRLSLSCGADTATTGESQLRSPSQSSGTRFRTRQDLPNAPLQVDPFFVGGIQGETRMMEITR